MSIRQTRVNRIGNKTSINLCSRLSTARRPCLCNISRIEANWSMHTRTRKNQCYLDLAHVVKANVALTWPWPV